MPAFFATLALAAGLATAPAPVQRDERFLVFVDGTHVGSADWTWRHGYRESTRIETAQGDGRSTTEDMLVLTPDDGGWSWERRRLIGSVRRRQAGRIDAAQWSHATPSGPAVVASLPAGVVLPLQRLERLRGFAMGDAARSAFAYLDLEHPRLVDITLERCDPAATSTPPGRCVAWREQGQAPQRWHFERDGRLARVESTLAGMALVLEACVDGCARRVAQPLDTVARLVVDSPHRIPLQQAQARLRYVLARADGERVELATTGEQAVVHDGPRAVVTVCADCGEATTETPASLAPFLAANAWVRSDAPAIRGISRHAGRSDAPLDVRMRRLAVQVRRRMRGGVDVLGYADAVQALRTGRGDCTEYAVLFAALARAQGIPTRVAVGMVYASRFTGHKQVFGPHAWVQAYDGKRWVSFDAAYDGFDSTHVALATGTGEPGPMYAAFVQLHQLRIERLGAIAP